MKATGFVFTFVILVVVGTQFVDFAQANFTPLPELPAPIYIRSDGSVEPSSASIERIGDVYRLTGNVNVTIEIQRDSIVFDGNNYNVTKPSVDTSQLMTPVGWLPSIYVLDGYNVTVKNVVFNKCYTGITVKNSEKIAVVNNTFNYNAAHGIVFWNCKRGSIVGNNMVGCGVAIDFLETAERFEVKHNTITESGWHAVWGGISNSKITGNSIVGNAGCALYSIGSNNVITYNNFENNERGILYYESESTIHHNNFINNGDQFHGKSPNTFDDGKEGNYWSDYRDKDRDGDGIGDSSYTISQNCKDYFPLAEPVELTEYKEYHNVPEFSSWTPLMILLLIVVVFVYKYRTHNGNKGKK